jgi:hypothetical protein
MVFAAFHVGKIAGTLAGGWWLAAQDAARVAALLTEIGRPLARKISSSWAGYADDAPTPYPAVLLAPRATIWALEFAMAVKVSREMIIKLLNMCSSP